MRCRVSALAVLCLLFGAVTLLAAEIRYNDVVYLGELKQHTIHLKTLQRTPITSSRDQSSVLGYLAPGSAVEILGWGETQCYIVATVTGRAVKGWVDARALEAPPAEVVVKLHTYLEKAQSLRELIGRHEVIATMTRAEVQASLGKPDRTTRLHTPEGEEEQWFYTVYKYLPHYTQLPDENGQLRQVVSYRREAAGRKVITFQNDEAVKIIEEQDKNASQPSVIVVPPAQTIP
jgi:hypothetical protein